MEQAINNLLRDFTRNIVATEVARANGDDLKEFLAVRRRNLSRLVGVLGEEATPGRQVLLTVLKSLHDFAEEALMGTATPEDLRKFEEFIGEIGE